MHPMLGLIFNKNLSYIYELRRPQQMGASSCGEYGVHFGKEKTREVYG